jgi:hypothetical protein
MKSDLEPESYGPASFAWPATEEFAEWLKADQANLDHWSEIVKHLVSGGGEMLPPDLMAKAKNLAARHHETRCLKKLQGKFKEIERAMLLPPPGAMPVEDRLSRLNAIMDEITDILLETPEPHRTTYLNRVLPARDWLRAYPVE